MKPTVDKASLVFILLLLSVFYEVSAQVSYNAAAAYGLRQIIPTYNGDAVQIKRSCDNATINIGFTSCGNLDTVALKAFVLASNPLSAMTVTTVAAYSLRRLSCAYAGSAVRVRSSATGSPTLDIGFTSAGDLDTAALKTFVGANNAFVTIWYDQSGNAHHAIQATNGRQPRLVNAGVIERQGSMPAVYFQGMGFFLSTTPFTAYKNAACFNGVAKVNANVTYNTIVNKSKSNIPSPLDFYNTQMVIGNGTAYSFYTYGQTFNASLPLSIWTYQAASGGSYNFYYNGSNTGSGTIGAYDDTGNALVLGSREDGVTGLNGWISEVTTYNSLPSATDRQFIEWSQAQYYSISGPVLSTLPASPASASVATWYDQSGNVRDAVQATAANQPRIINAGAIEKNSGIPAISFTGASHNLVAPLSANAYPVSIAIVANTSGATTKGAFVKLGTNTNNSAQGGVSIGVGNSGGDYDNTGTSVIGTKEWVAFCPSNPNVNYPAAPFIGSLIQQSGVGGTSIYLNGTNIPLSNSATAVGGSITGSLYIGGYNAGTNRYPSVMESEVIVYGSALSATRRTLLETHQSAYNSITVSTNKYTPPGASAYRLYVNGVGRESSTDSVGGTRSTTGMGFIIGQTGSDFLKDNGDYLTIGMNCPVSAAVSTLNLPATVVQRWNNDWYLNKTDVGTNNGTINFFFDFSDYGVSGSPGTAANYELLARSSAAGNFSIVAGTTKSVVGDRVMFAVDAANITTNYYYTIGTKSISVSPLPIELESFEANCSGDKAQLKWVVASQHNNAYFTVERTDNGQDFKTVGTVKGAGTTPQKITYNYTDDDPLPGLSYYRLKQTDFDGTERYYGLRQALCDPEKEIRIYPNPAQNAVTIEALKHGSEVTIINNLGKVIYTQKDVTGTQTIDLSGFPNGIYFIRISRASSILSSKLVISR